MTVHEDGSRTFTVYEAAEENLRDKGQGRKIVSYFWCLLSIMMYSISSLEQYPILCMIISVLFNVYGSYFGASILNIYCKIDKAGAHVAIMMPQWHAWTNLLVHFHFANQNLANTDSGTVGPVLLSAPHWECCLLQPSNLIGSTTWCWNCPCHRIWTCSMAASTITMLLFTVYLSHHTSGTANHSCFNISSYINIKSHLYCIVSRRKVGRRNLVMEWANLLIWMATLLFALCTPWSSIIASPPSKKSWMTAQIPLS